MHETSALSEAGSTPTEETPSTPGHSPADEERDEQSLADSLVEDISIDGMCGVY